MLGIAGCSSDEAGNDFIEISGHNGTVYAEFPEGQSGNYRGYKTLASTNWRGAAYVIKMDVSDSKAITSSSTGPGGVVGLTFDGSNYKNDDGVEVNDFYLLGMRYNGTCAQIYLSRFEGVTNDDLEGVHTSGTFGTEYELINASSSTSSSSTSGAYYNLSKVTPINNILTLSVIVYQKYNSGDNATYSGKYGIAIYSGDITEKLTQKDFVEKFSAGTDGYSLPDGNLVGSSGITMAKTATSNGKLFTSISNCNSDTLESFGTLTDKNGKTITEDDQGRFGFYGNVYTNGLINATFTCLDADLEAEVVEE